jgi:hypothetical protein
MRFLIPLLFVSPLLAAPKWRASDVMDKNESARRVDQLQAKGKIVIDGGSRRRMEKTFTWWRKVQKDGTHFNTLTKFHTPVTVKDQSILFLEAANDKTEILMYLPTFKKTRIIESSQQNSSFMASDFTFSDITTIQKEDYSFTEAGIESCPNEKKIKCYKIEAKLKNLESADRLGYTRLTIWMRADNFMNDRIQYYNQAGKLYKELNASQIVQIAKGKYFSKYLIMKNLTNGQFTILEFSEVEANKSIPESRFYKQKLGKDA